MALTSKASVLRRQSKRTTPVGGEDLDKVKGDVILTFAGANEPPVVLLGDKESRPPHEGEIIYFE